MQRLYSLQPRMLQQLLCCCPAARLPTQHLRQEVCHTLGLQSTHRGTECMSKPTSGKQPKTSSSTLARSFQGCQSNQQPQITVVLPVAPLHVQCTITYKPLIAQPPESSPYPAPPRKLGRSLPTAVPGALPLALASPLSSPSVAPAQLLCA
jgi:hypothetical protein